MKEPRFRNKRGDLSAYAFRCGYVENKGSLNLYMEHNTYHVAGLIEETYITGSFDTLKEARQCLAHPMTHTPTRTGSVYRCRKPR